MATMTPEERDALVTVLERSEDHFQRVVGSLSPADWIHRPAPGKWNAAELAEHLALSEEAFARLIQKALDEPPEEHDRTAALAVDQEIVSSMQDDSLHRTAAEEITPHRVFRSGPEASKTFLERRARTLNYVRNTDDALRMHTWPHPAYGEIDGYQWLLMLAHHVDRHVRQMERAVSGER
jgi:hypothetical protein